jgi:hypothetical protein
MLRVKNKKNQENNKKTKIKRMRTELNTKTIWNKIFRYEIKKKLQKILQAKQIVIKRMRTKNNRNKN